MNRSLPSASVYNETAELIGYAGRAVDDELAKTDGRYKTPFKKSLVLYNLHRVLEMETGIVTVVDNTNPVICSNNKNAPNTTMATLVRIFIVL